MTVSERVFLAVDLGASSGRVMAGLFNGNRLRLEQVHRFDNRPVVAAGHMHWDALALWSAVLDGLQAAAAANSGGTITSVGVDTWGVDFALLGRNDELLGNPYHYRDHRTLGMMEKVFEKISREEIFAETGLQFMELNTLYQLVAMQQTRSSILDAAESLLLMPDFFHWLLTGKKAVEFTNATTTQFYNPSSQSWSTKLFDRLGLPQRILCDIVQPGTRLGRIRKDVAANTGLDEIEVILPGTHDTASAVMAVPACGSPTPQPDWCYISSGTWSLMGVEIPAPVIHDRCRERNFTNEGGVGGTIRLLKNIAGLWFVQECRRLWAQQGRDYVWDQLVHLAEESPRLISFIDPDEERFVAPANMVESIRGYCSDTGQTVPDNEGQVIRCILESLSMRYRQVLGWMDELTGGRIETVHIVGGGSQNQLLCQMAANATGRQVIAGPTEATSIGNLLVQATAAKEVGSIVEAREVVRNSFDVQEYLPRDVTAWDDAFERFRQATTG